MTTIKDAPVNEMPKEDWKLWMLGALLSLAFLLIGTVYSSLDERVTALAREGSPPTRERLSALEAEQHAMQRQWDTDIRVIRDSVTEISRKIDRLVEDQHPSRKQQE